MFATSRLLRSLVPIVAIAIAGAAAATAAAQNNARVFGGITDPGGQPVEDVTVTLVYEGGLARSYEVATNAEGEFLQMGLVRGPYTLTAIKEGVGINRAAIDLSAGQSLEHDLTLRSLEEVYRESVSEEERAALDAQAATTDAFEQGLAAVRGGDLATAVGFFQTALETTPECAECQRNLGIVQGRLGAYDDAEAAFRAALALEPDNAESYVGLAEIYNAQRRFDDAAEASAAAARLSGGGGGDDATAVFDQGLIFWNSGRLDEARQQFERTLELDPSHGEAHYWLGMANLNAGQMAEAAAEFEIYLDREPNGRFAATATGILSSIR
ncbi:MAG: tetratricopeptide repeat protein [Acidobacteria bacterium]|nr:tetratricopeptide repeat protein [Acidobacteriota bacterium]